MSAYTDADVEAAQEAIDNFFGPDGNYNHYAAREAVAAAAPAIAARALRELALDADSTQMPVLDGGSSCIDILARADEIEAGS